ncbi:MAG: hypothetical protein KGH57_00530 [Candidatus Micrarchaeota archaeon]|nr:hypothetical protein [Candidatus Micrarchaeota archaeon]
MRNVAVLSHIADIDGVGAASLVRIRYKIPLSNVFFTGHDYGEVVSAEAGLRRLYRRGILLFVTDLTPGDETAPIYEKIVGSVNRNGGKVIFLDHHPWSDKLIRRIAKKCLVAVFGENRQMCATELVKKYTGLDTKFVREFAHIVHHADFYIQLAEKRHSKLVDDYAMHLAGVNMSKSYAKRIGGLRHVVAVISSGRFEDKAISEGAERFRKLNRDRIAKMLESVYRVSNRIGIGFTKQVDSTEACMAIIHKERLPMSVVVNLDHMKGSIRSTGPNITPLANAFGGGGHPHASGFSIDARTYGFFKTQTGREKFIKDVQKNADRAKLL